MKLPRSTYSSTLVQSHPSYSAVFSPSYSYSRVSNYLDALQKDEQINKLKREITHAKSLDMKYHSLLQEISIAQKDNQILECRNQKTQKDYVEKIQLLRMENAELQGQLQKSSLKLVDEEVKAETAQKEIQELLLLLKDLKLEEQSIQKQNQTLETQIDSCNTHLANLNEEKSQLLNQKSNLFLQSKQCAEQMQNSLKKLTLFTELKTKCAEELLLLKNESECFNLEFRNVQAICDKNTTLIQNLERKILIGEGQNQQIKYELDLAQQEWKNMQTKFFVDKENLYQNIIKVEQHGVMLKDCLNILDSLLEKDSTEKKYLKDISTKYSMLCGQNQKMRQTLKYMKEIYNEKKAQQNELMEVVHKKLKTNESLKQAINQRDQQLIKIKVKFVNG